jgi:putative ABC transport system permease protein
MITGIAWKNIWHKPLNALLGWLLLTASVAIVSLLLLLQEQFQQKFESNIQGIDLVMGAKGSPLQLILSSVYHLDNPTGNIDYAEVQKWMKNPMVQSAIPLAYGDSYRGFPIVGATPAYLEKYAATVGQGRVFQENFDVVLGAEIARKEHLSIGQEFFGVHGASAEGEEHHEHAYRVTGILEPNGTVLDNLILSNLESVWAMHDHESEGVEHLEDTHQEDISEKKQEHLAEHSHTPEHREEHPKATHEHEEGHNQAPEAPPGQTKGERHREITAVLFKFRSPMAIVQWPRMVAQQTDMQLASPAVELNRIFSLFGVGFTSLTYLGWAIMGLAVLSVLIALYNALKERRYELALMRAMGAGRGQLMRLLLFESLWLCLAGFFTGILLSRLALWFISTATAREYRFSFEEFGFKWPQEGWLFLFTLGAGVVAALFPALMAYRLDISKTLANE